MRTSTSTCMILALVVVGIAGGTWRYFDNRAAAALLPGEISAKDLQLHIGESVTFRGIAHLHFKIGPFIEVGDTTVMLNEKPANIADGQAVVARGLLEFRTLVPIVQTPGEVVQSDAGRRFIMKNETVTPIR